MGTCVTFCVLRAQELCESRGGRPGLPVPNSPHGFCGRKETMEKDELLFRAQELCESRGGRPGLHIPNSPYGLRGHKEILEKDELLLKVEVDVPNSPYGIGGRKAPRKRKTTSWRLCCSLSSNAS